MLRIIRTRRALLGGAGLALGLLVDGGQAWASFTGCGTDPVVTLSNGTVVTMTASIGTTISNVQQVNYVLHVPRGVTINSIAYDQYGALESVQLVQDQPLNTYATQTTVQVTGPIVPVTAYTSISGKPGTQSATGTSGQDLTVSINAGPGGPAPAGPGPGPAAP